MFDNYVHVLTPSLLFVTPGIAHRDLKPENILCESPEKVLRAWFGMLQFEMIRNDSASIQGVRNSPGQVPSSAYYCEPMRILYLIHNVPSFQPDVAVYTCSSRTQEAQTGGSPWVQCQPQLQSETLFETIPLPLPKKKKIPGSLSLCLFDLIICIISFSLQACKICEPCTALIFSTPVLQSSCMNHRQLKMFFYMAVSLPINANYGVVLCQMVSTICSSH